MSKPLLVMKFGGTSVGSPSAIARAVSRVREQSQKWQVVVVVSAMGGVTDLLLNTLAAGENGERKKLADNLDHLLRQHLEACDKLLVDAEDSRREGATKRIRKLVRRFKRIAVGMFALRESPPKAIDAAVPTGELLSALLFSERLEATGQPSRAVSGADVIVTDASHGEAHPDLQATASQVEAVLRPLCEAGSVPVVTGFNGSTEDGVMTTLGRGGSDYSAAVIGAALDAEEVWIWTDVDGILTCDPTIESSARLLRAVTYNEAAELAYNGAKVLHPKTLAPVTERAIPVYIKNSFNPSATGTRISSDPPTESGVRAVTSLSNVVLISIEAADLSAAGAHLMAKALQAAARTKVEVLLLSRSSFQQNFCMLVHGRDKETLLAGLREELALELKLGYVRAIDANESVGLLAAVGEGMRGTPGLAGRLFMAISNANVNIVAIAQGSSELTIAIVVSQQDLALAVSSIHEQCIERGGAQTSR